MSIETTYCINCMSEVSPGTEVCPYCHHRINEYKANPRALLPMTLLDGKYLIGKVLGEGGFGITYLGLDRNLRLKVAIKEYFPLQFASRNIYDGNSNDITVIGGKAESNFMTGLDRYEREARRLVRLDSLPGIVKVLNFFYENKTAYMVMEYIPGISLKEYMRSNKRITWKETLSIAKPVIKSLGILHKNGIIHRDISPDNIMMDPDGQITLIDFGAARDFNNADKSVIIELKHGFAPPEQYQTSGNQGPWTDVYALCATLYYLISGKVIPSAMAIYDKNEKIKPLRSYDRTIPQGIEDTILQGLSPNIKNRIHDMDTLYDRLYRGKVFIPWKKIFITVVIAAVVVTIILVARKSGNIYRNYISRTDKDMISTNLMLDNDGDQNISLNITDEADTKEENSDNIEDTAANYVLTNQLIYTDSTLLRYDVDESGIVITGADSSLTDIVIPEEIDGIKVTAISGIGNNVTSLILPDSLLIIEDGAFKNCVYLEYIYISENVSSIGTGVFDNCLSLSEVHISDRNPHFYVNDGAITDYDGNIYN